MPRRRSRIPVGWTAGEGEKLRQGRLSRLGIRSGEAFDAATVSSEVCNAVEEGAAAAKQRLVDAAPRMDRVIDGWAQPISGMGVYGTDHLRRAIVAKIGLGANLIKVAVDPVLFTDADGTTPQGEVDYVLRFPADRLPPVDAFWSVTIYDSEGFPAPNDIERYAIGDRDTLQYGPEGSLTLYLQHNDPGEARRSNWLPSPLGRLGVTMRLYGPRPEALDGSWTPPPLTTA